MELDLKSLRRRKIYYLKKPMEVGCYSLDGERHFHDDCHQMKYLHRTFENNLQNFDDNLYELKPKNLYLDLNLDSQNAIKKDFRKKEKINPILTWIKHHSLEVENYFDSSDTNSTKIDFVCSRGLLRRIALTYCEKGSDWTFCASKHNSVIYLCGFDTNAKEYWRENVPPRSMELETWYSKFVQKLTRDFPLSQTSVLVNEKEEYHTVIKRKLNHHTLLFNAQVDGRNRSTGSYVEFKLIGIERERKYMFSRYQLVSWYLQSYLAGIPEIIIGLRDGSGIVQSLHKLNTSETIPQMLKHSPKLPILSDTDPGTSLNLCSDILDFVKKCVEEDNPDIIYKFSWGLGTTTIKCEKLHFSEEYQVLPEWYTKL